VGRSAALAPGRAAFRRAFARLLPAAEPALAALASLEDLVERKITEACCPTGWVPGLVLIGDAAHFLGPEAGLGAGLGLGDALALARALEDAAEPDAACREYVRWREPAVPPCQAIGVAGARPPQPGGDSERPPEERWPPR